MLNRAIRHCNKFVLCYLIFFANQLSAEELTEVNEFDFELEFELDRDIDMDSDIDPSLNESSLNTFVPSKLLSSFRFTFDHNLSINPHEYRDIINNRSSIRIEYDDLIDENLYAKIDTFAYVYWANDFISEISNSSIEFQGRVKESWIQRSWQNIYLKFGLQHIVWSEVDSSRATDTINAVDNSELLFIDFKDARLGQWMLSGKYYHNKKSWEGFVNFVPKFNKNPRPGSIYNMFPTLGISKAKQPDPEVGVRVKMEFAATEVAFLVANLAPNQPAIEIQATDIQTTGFSVQLQERANRFWLTGINFNMAHKKYLWTFDLAYKTEQAFYTAQSPPLLVLPQFVYKDIVDLAMGLEYSWQKSNLKVSATRTIINNWQTSLVTKRQTGLFLISWSRTFLNEDLTVSTFVGKIFNESSNYASTYFDYALDDNTSLIATLFWFDIDSSNTTLSLLNDNDRVSIKAQFQF